MTKFPDLASMLRIEDILKDKVLSKEAKETISELSVLVDIYAITVLSEICKGREVTEDDVAKVFDSLKPC